MAASFIQSVLSAFLFSFSHHHWQLKHFHLAEEMAAGSRVSGKLLSVICSNIPFVGIKPTHNHEIFIPDIQLHSKKMLFGAG